MLTGCSLILGGSDSDAGGPEPNLDADAPACSNQAFDNTATVVLSAGTDPEGTPIEIPDRVSSPSLYVDDEQSVLWLQGCEEPCDEQFIYLAEGDDIAFTLSDRYTDVMGRIAGRSCLRSARVRGR